MTTAETSWRSNSLAVLAARIRLEHDAVETTKAAATTAARRGIEHALACGALLIEAKAQVPHGQWLPWLTENCPAVKERMAQRYMRLAEGQAVLGTQKRHVSDLSLREALKLLEPDKDEDGDEDEGDGGDDAGDDGDDDCGLTDQQKDQIRALQQNFKWGPEAIAKALNLPEESVRRFLQPTDDDDDDDDDDDEPDEKGDERGNSLVVPATTST